jgi:hypothetical protein
MSARVRHFLLPIGRPLIKEIQRKKNGRKREEKKNIVGRTKKKTQFI